MNAVAAELPYAVKKSKVIWMIQTAPPPKPLCFDTDAQWVDYLMYLAASGERITRRQDLGKWYAEPARTVTTVFDRIDHCQDCDIGGERQRRMQVERRCILPPHLESTVPLVPTLFPPRKDHMLKRLSHLLAQLKQATGNGQIGMLPGDGGMAIVVSWQVGDSQFEVATHFTRAECEAASDQQIGDAVEVMIGSVWSDVAKCRGEKLTPSEAVARIREAAGQSPKNLALTAIAQAALGPLNG